MLQRIGQAAAAAVHAQDAARSNPASASSLGYAGIYSPSADQGHDRVQGDPARSAASSAATPVGAASDQADARASRIGGLRRIPAADASGSSSRSRATRRRSTYGLADGLDLMVVCVEAGLTVDAAMQRVGQELAIAHPAISREFAHHVHGNPRRPVARRRR